MAGPSVEVQVRVNTGGSVAGSVSNWKVISPEIQPVGRKNYYLHVAYYAYSAPEQVSQLSKILIESFLSFKTVCCAYHLLF